MSEDKLAVLVVEDSEPIQQLLTESLTLADCDVEVVSRVGDALFALDTRHFDLALVDLQLADDHPGWEIVERLRRNTDPLMVVLSGSHNPSDASRAMAAGSPYILKPADAHQIALVLDAALKRRESVRREGRRQRDV